MQRPERQLGRESRPGTFGMNLTPRYKSQDCDVHHSHLGLWSHVFS